MRGKVCENGSFEPYICECNLFTKTGSGQTQGKLKKDYGTVLSGARAYPGWARQASARENCCAVLTACGVVGSCCGEMLGLSEASENEIDRLRRRADETKAAMKATDSTSKSKSM